MNQVSTVHMDKHVHVPLDILMSRGNAASL